MSESDQEYVASSEDEAGHFFNGKKLSKRAERTATRKAATTAATDPKQNADGAYVWEGEFQRSWDLVQEDEEGGLTGVVAGLVQSGKRKRWALILLCRAEE
jgi:transcription initiation factor TFIIH subunit 2